MHADRPCRIRRGIPTASDLSRQAWVGEAAAARLPACIDAIREPAVPFDPLAVFLGGSAIHGELCGIVTPEGERRFLSDLDLGILTARRLDSETRRTIDRRLAACPEWGPEAKAGFYCEADLARQDPTPGMVETARSGWVLSGAKMHLERFEVPPPRAIPAWEASRLLANRVLEWIEARRSGEAIRQVYAAGKAIADIAAVALIAKGRYEGGGYAARAASVAREGLVPPRSLARLERWTAWRLSPEWDCVPAGGNPLRAVETGSVDEDLRASIEDGLSLCGEDPEGLSCFADSPASPRVKVRSWRRWISRGGPERRLPGPGVWSRTPRSLLWEAAVWFSLGRSEACRGALGAIVRAPESERGGETIVRLWKRMDEEGIE